MHLDCDGNKHWLPQYCRDKTMGYTIEYNPLCLCHSSSSPLLFSVSVFKIKTSLYCCHHNLGLCQ
jgi:hypothetical protein